jgi:hypothetical protein
LIFSSSMGALYSLRNLSLGRMSAKRLALVISWS